VTRRLPDRVVMLVTDRYICAGRALEEVVAAAVEGGVNVVQLREKGLPAGELLLLARRLRGICGSQALLIVNDRADVAMLCGADGVQLGETGLPTAAVRKWLPPSLLVGRSVHSVNAARQAEAEGADYVILGSLFPTDTHPGQSPAGLSLLEGVRERLCIPVIGIGGITPDNAGLCWRAGAQGVAVIRAILDAPDPRAAARALAPPPAAPAGGGEDS